MFLFGGISQQHQISKVENCRLTSIGELNFSMKYGACTNVGDELVFICFHDTDDSSTDKKCWKASEPLASFQAAPDSSHPHRNTRIGNNGGTMNFNYRNSLFQKKFLLWEVSFRKMLKLSGSMPQEMSWSLCQITLLE